MKLGLAALNEPSMMGKHLVPSVALMKLFGYMITPYIYGHTVNHCFYSQAWTH